ncbi:hypothetical protein OOZ35_07840 [Mesoflavibacter profundi]|uniref:DUF4468 domain-containing protein n=1 Tax=Mesoflavibacter profundi TaxID=2708110 RepID=A0ABT4S007_9FLAO|nr:hypothetical protein [Mesoflavibacter profundi]MDA0177397.1 hypothetical protein [Mesoflavibacter profundi]
MKKIFAIILTLIGILAFGQENKMTEIDNQSKSIDSDTELIESNFDLNNESKLKVWHKEKQIFKIVQERNVDYGEIKSEIYLIGNKPIKITESESTYFFLTDSIAKIKGYSVDIEENFRAISYITNWNKKQRELIISGEPTEKKNISYELNKYAEIIRKTEKLTNE